MLVQDLTFDEKKDWIRLSRTENVGPVTFKTLLSVYGTPKNALKNLPDFAKRGGRKKPLVIPDEGQICAEMEKVEELNGTMLCFCETDFPSLLRQISDCPMVLTVLGDKMLLRKKMVALVGTRNATLNGKNLARKFSLDFAMQDYVVVSGMAKGIDTAAHTGALDAPPDKGGTIAVLGTGPDVIYPLENEKLYRSLTIKGAVVSELPLGAKPFAGQFPRRNRIISGMSRATVVIEAQPNSGSLITADLARSQGKDVFAVPGFPSDPRSQGTNQLIKEGKAQLTESASDVIERIDSSFSKFLRDSEQLEIVFPQILADEGELAVVRSAVKENLSGEPVFIDDLAREIGVASDTLGIVLSEMELADRLVRYAGNRVALVM